MTTDSDRPTSIARPPTLHDVAREAGVSHQTVSRVVRGAASVRESTARRVNEAISTLGYRPNLAARALAEKPTASPALEEGDEKRL